MIEDISDEEIMNHGQRESTIEIVLNQPPEVDSNSTIPILCGFLPN